MHFSVTRDVMAAILTVRHIKLNIWLCRLRPTYLKKNPAKFHPDPIWNNGASGFFDEVAPTTRTTGRREAIWDQFL